jgi:hypothetical protein
VPPRMEVLVPMDAGEYGREQHQSDMHGPAVVEVEETPNGHDANEQALRGLLANQMGGQRRVGLNGESKRRLEKDENTETDRQPAQYAIDHLSDNSHSIATMITLARN